MQEKWSYNEALFRGRDQSQIVFLQNSRAVAVDIRPVEFLLEVWQENWHTLLKGVVILWENAYREDKYWFLVDRGQLMDEDEGPEVDMARQNGSRGQNGQPGGEF